LFGENSKNSASVLNFHKKGKESCTLILNFSKEEKKFQLTSKFFQRRENNVAPQFRIYQNQSKVPLRQEVCPKKGKKLSVLNFSIEEIKRYQFLIFSQKRNKNYTSILNFSK